MTYDVFSGTLNPTHLTCLLTTSQGIGWEERLRNDLFVLCGM